jgi:hypothetical protein
LLDLLIDIVPASPIKSVENNYEVVNLYSESVIPYGQPTHLVLNFQQLINYNTCTDEDKIMNLYVWVNGFMVQKFCIPNLLFKGLNMQKEHQIGIPYNISIGGGTLGLLYDTLHTAPKTLCEYDLCVSLYSQNITEYSYDGNVYYVDIPVSEIEKFVQDNFDKDFKAYLTSKNKKYIYKGTIKTTKRIDYIKFGISCISSVTPLNCKDVTIQNDDVLTQNYAGTFIGNIYCFNFYNSYITVQDIRHKLATNCIGVSYENCYRC